MPEARLKIVIEEGGASPVGGPAPEAVRQEARASKPSTGTAGGAKPEGERAKPDMGVQELLQAVAKAIPGLGPLVDFGKTVSDLAGRVGSEVKTPRDRTTLPVPPTLKSPDANVAADIEATARAMRDMAKEASGAESAIDRVTAAMARAGDVPIPSGVQKPADGDGPTIIAPRIGGAPSLPAPPTTRVPTTSVAPAPNLARAGGAAEAVSGTAAMSRLAGAVGIAIGGLTALGFAADKAGDALERQARDLSKFSPELAASTARADIRAMMLEMERARAIGPELARFQDNWSKLDANVSRLGTLFQKAALEVINPMGDLAVKMTTGFTNFMELSQANANLIIAALNGNKDEQKAAREELARIRQRIEEPEAEFDDEDFERALFAPIGGLNPQPLAPRIQAGRAQAFRAQRARAEAEAGANAFLGQ